MMAATAMIGTASFGPNSYASTGTSMIDEPVPMIPLMVPARRPITSTNRKAMIMADRDGRESRWLYQIANAADSQARISRANRSVRPQAPTFTALRLAIRRCSTAAASRFSTTTVSSQSMQPSVMLCP